MSKHILVPIDGSEHSRKTLKKACALAKDLEADICILQVTEMAVYANYAIEMHEWHMEFEKMKEAEIDQFKDILDESGVSWKRELRRGSAAHEILAYAEEAQCDLIVIGNHGVSSGARFFMGSTCSKVSMHAPCDVYVVK